MRRRQFSVSLLAGSATIASGLLALPAAVQASPTQPQEGTDFWLVKPPQPNDAPEGQIQVIEFFAYSCSHCHDFEPTFNAWASQLPKDIYLQRVPVSFRSIVEPHARIYYTLEALNRLDLHDVVFKTFWNRSLGMDLIDPAQISTFFASQGLDANVAMQTYNSFGVQSKVQRANALVKNYGIEGTPAIGIAGKYWLAGASQSTLRVSEILIGRVRATL